MRLFVLTLFIILSLRPDISLAETDKCITCHDVLERYANVPKMGHLSCTGCHFGDGSTEDKQVAHEGMYSDPTDIKILDQTCGACHAQYVAAAKQRLNQ